MALAADRRDAARRGFDRAVHLLELSFRRTDRAHSGRFRDERYHPPVVVHSGVHRRADSVEWSERSAPDGRTLSVCQEITMPSCDRGGAGCEPARRLVIGAIGPIDNRAAAYQAAPPRPALNPCPE